MRNGAWVLMVAVMLLAGCRREKTAQAKGAPAESSRTAAVDSTRMEMELIEWVGDDWRVEHFMWLVHVCVERSRIFAKILEG